MDPVARSALGVGSVLLGLLLVYVGVQVLAPEVESCSLTPPFDADGAPMTVEPTPPRLLLGLGAIGYGLLLIVPPRWLMRARWVFWFSTALTLSLAGIGIYFTVPAAGPFHLLILALLFLPAGLVVVATTRDPRQPN